MRLITMKKLYLVVCIQMNSSLSVYMAKYNMQVSASMGLFWIEIMCAHS